MNNQRTHKPIVPPWAGPPWCSCGWKSAWFPKPGESLADHLRKFDPTYGSPHFKGTA